VCFILYYYYFYYYYFYFFEEWMSRFFLKIKRMHTVALKRVLTPPVFHISIYK